MSTVNEIFAILDRITNELTVSVMLEEALGSLISDDCGSLIGMDASRIGNAWKEIRAGESRLAALDYLLVKLASNKSERVVLRVLWCLDNLIESGVYSPKEVAHALIRSDHLRPEATPLFQCAFQLLTKLVLYLDYKSNREVFTKTIEKSTYSPVERAAYRQICHAVEFIQMLLSRELCLMPAYFAMHELIRSVPVEASYIPQQQQYTEKSIKTFMDSFLKPARLLYSTAHRAFKPICGITHGSSLYFRLDASNLTLTSVKGAMRYPDCLTTPQFQLTCDVLGQLRSTELVFGMLDQSAGKSKKRSTGLELALVEWIVELMELIEATKSTAWVDMMTDHLINLVITFMLSSSIRFNELVIKLNSKLEGRTWNKSCHYVMWFVLNATSGFIGKNMLTDFVPCLRLFDILFPETEVPDRAIGVQSLGCRRNCCSAGGAQTITTAIPPTASSDKASPGTVEEGKNVTPGDEETGDDADDFDDWVADSSADDSDIDKPADERATANRNLAERPPSRMVIQDLLPFDQHRISACCCRRQNRLVHLTTAPVCLWQHVLRKNKVSQDHLPRVMPPTLRPLENRIAHRVQCLLTSLHPVEGRRRSADYDQILQRLTWRQLFVVLNAYSTDAEVNLLIQQVVELFWSGAARTSQSTSSTVTAAAAAATSSYQTGTCVWLSLLDNGPVPLPYGLTACGRLKPLPRHLIRTMTVHLRMLILHMLLQKLTSLQHVDQLTPPAVLETMCRILACRGVEPSNMNRLLQLLGNLHPTCSRPGQAPPSESAATSSSSSPRQSGPTEAGSSSLPTCYLASALLDLIGHRLSDVLSPEVRVHTLTTFVGLSRSWFLHQQVLNSEETGPASRLHRPGCLPLELFYMLEWCIVKQVRSIQVPDCAIYYLCSIISPAAVMQVAQQAAMLAAGLSGSDLHANSTASSGQYGARLSGGDLAVSISATGQLRSGVTASLGIGHAAAPTAINTDLLAPGSSSAAVTNTSTTATAAAAGNPATAGLLSCGTLTGYPLLIVNDQIEVNRWIVFSLLQICAAFELEEIAGMKTFFVEQLCLLCDSQVTATATNGPSAAATAASDRLPRLIISHLPDFLLKVVARYQRQSPGLVSSAAATAVGYQHHHHQATASPVGDLVSGNPSGVSAIERLASMPTVVADICQLIIVNGVPIMGTVDEEIAAWSRVANHPSNVLLCVMLHFMAATRTIPKPPIQLMLTLGIPQLNVYLRVLCDYVVALVSGTKLGGDTLVITEEQCLSNLCDFLLIWRIVPLDRFLLFLLMHTHYQGTHLEAVNRIIFYIFTKCDTVSRIIGQLRMSDFALDTSGAPRKRVPHPDPVSSQDWPSLVRSLHESLPDQWMQGVGKCTNPPAADPLSSGSDPRAASSSCSMPSMPVVYGHLVFRLLPLLEVILCQLVDCRFPLMRLITFCRAISPLFRFHRRPVNICYILLRGAKCLNDAALVSGTVDFSGSDLDRQLQFFVMDRLRLLAIVHCVLQQHQLAAELTTATLATCQQQEVTGEAMQVCEDEVAPTTRRCAPRMTATLLPDYRLFSPVGWARLDEFLARTPSRGVRSQREREETREASQRQQYLLTTWWVESHSDLRNWQHLGDGGLSSPAAILVYARKLFGPLVESTRRHYLSGHPAAWRPSKVEESVSIQAAGLYAAAVELLTLLPSPAVFVDMVSGFLSASVSSTTTSEFGDCLNTIGALTAILPATYRHPLWHYCLSLFADPALSSSGLSPGDHSPQTVAEGDTSWLGSRRTLDYLLRMGIDPRPGDESRQAEPQSARLFFTHILPVASANSCGEPAYARQTYLLKADLWHAIWAHANTTHFVSLPRLFMESVHPQVRNEAQMLTSFYLFAPLMGVLHAEKPASLVDLTVEFYRIICKVDLLLADAGAPLVHVDTIADLLYHIKYMYVGHGVSDHVRPLLPQLRANLRKRLKFILPPSESTTLAVASGVVGAGGCQAMMDQLFTNSPVLEEHAYRAAGRPPVPGGGRGGDF